MEVNKIEAVLDTYIISELTCALIPTRSIDHQTKVIERDHIYYVNQSPLEIIKQNCLLNGSDYNGRREAVKYHLGYSRKSPIAISKLIYAFPTHAITHYDCIWLFSKQISYIKHISSLSKVIFKNHYILKLPISEHILNKQHLRCFAVKNLYKSLTS